MKIKSFILALTFVGASLAGFAQKGELNSAKSNYEKYAQLKDANSAALGLTNLKNAQASVDKATTHDKTKSDPSAWTYKALIYSELALLDSIPTSSKPLLTEAATALSKAKELDKGGENKANLDKVNANLAQYDLNLGVKAYQAGKFEEAYTSFNNSLSFRPGDTTIIYYAGLSAINAKNYKAGIQKYEDLVKTNFSSNNQVYLDLSRLYTMQGDTTKAISIASEGAAKFPNDAALATQEIELSLISGKQKEVISKIEAQAQKDPKNKLLPFYLGIAYNASNQQDKALAAYKQALAIDPEFGDANLNIGGLYLNKGIDLYNTANKLPQNKQKEYDVMMKKASAEFDAAFPYLQKAVELDPKSRLALDNLKTYYIIKKNQAKVDEITKKIEGLQ
jgi:tetratricopeptide (TPR) repeat protein